MNPSTTCRTLLLIEDNEQNRYLATFLLERHGYRVVSAEDGVQGIELAHAMAQAARAEAGAQDNESVPWAILLDIQLPRMDGYAVARVLRADPLLANLPIIAVTSYAMPGDREKALECGCSAYLEKPIDPDTFAVQIERLSASRDVTSA